MWLLAQSRFRQRFDAMELESQSILFSNDATSLIACRSKSAGYCLDLVLLNHRSTIPRAWVEANSQTWRRYCEADQSPKPVAS
jgi:hypothetical protein